MSKADKIFAKMRRTQSGWGQNDFRSVYLSFGFQMREGSNHTFYWHDKYPTLTASVGRHDALARGYAEHAIKIIARLQELEQERKEQQQQEENK